MDTKKMTWNNRGGALVFVALALVVLIGFLGLVIDVGHLYIVHGELQNAADASALAGANSLYTGTPPTLDLATAQTTASAFITQNNTDGVPLSTATVATGYWDSATKTIVSVPGTPAKPAAVSVTVSRSAGTNGGAVPVFFAQVLPGVAGSAPVSATAVASTGFPGSVPSGDLFPLAVSSCMTNSYFANPPGTPTTITITTPYAPGGTNCYTGQWTSFKSDANDTQTINDYMTGATPSPALQTGDKIWIEPGAKAALYKDVNNWLSSIGSSGTGKDVLLAIVDSNSGNITTHGEMTITGFATYHIVSADQSLKTVTGYFVSFSKTFPGVTSGGAISNTIAPPTMVN